MGGGGKRSGAEGGRGKERRRGRRERRGFWLRREVLGVLIEIELNGIQRLKQYEELIIY